MSVTLDWTSAAFVRCGKKYKLNSDCGDSGSKKYKRGYYGAYSGVWRSLCLAGAWIVESGGRFCVGVFGRNLASVAVKMFSHLIYFFQTFYKFCTFNVICKDNAAMNCITVQHTQKKSSIPVNFDGSYAIASKVQFCAFHPLTTQTNIQP
jgi:hypothetical protein